MKKVINNIFLYIDSNIKVIIPSIILFVVNYGLLAKVDSNKPGLMNYTFLFLLLMSIGIYVSLNIFNKKNIKVENQFLIISITLGILFSIVFPLYSIPDEDDHFYRAYEITEGHLISNKDEEGNGGNFLSENMEEVVPKDLGNITYKEMFSKKNIKLNNKKKYYKFSNTSLHSFICYIPQSIGIMLGKILNLPIIYMAYLGRFMNLIVSIAILYFSIKYIPFGKKIISIISFMPMFMQEMISLSPDAITNAVSIAFISFVFYMVNNKKGLMTKSQNIIMICLTLLIAMLKIVYLPICLLLFLIPQEKFKSKKEKILKILILELIAIGINLIWLKISSGYLIEFTSGVNSPKQIKFILTHPYNYLLVLFNTIESNFINYILMMIGSNLEWLNVYVSQPYLLFFILIFIKNILNDRDIKVTKNQKYLLSFITLSIIILIFTSLYVQWTPLMYKEVLGIQGRYFIPLILLVLFMFKPSKSKINKKVNYELLYRYILNIDIYAVLLLFYTHI